MKKGEDYDMLKAAGLPVPIYGVFDGSSLIGDDANADLRSCVDKILNRGSGLIGVRTEPKARTSPLGNYPHYMPLRSLNEVISTIRENELIEPVHYWWYLINEAFLDYEWNAVVKVSRDGAMPGYWNLDGEVNLKDNCPLRPALENAANVMRAGEWRGTDSAQIRKQILKSGLIETWIEISKVRTPKGSRLVYWGLRGERPKK